MRHFTLAALLLFATISGTSLLCQFERLELTIDRPMQRIILRLVPAGIIIDRLHPYPTAGGWYLAQDTSRKPIPNFIAGSPMVRHLFPGVQYDDLPGRSGSSVTPGPPNCWLNVLGVRWWLIDLMVTLPLVPALRRRWKRRTGERGFAIEPQAAVSSDASQ